MKILKRLTIYVFFCFVGSDCQLAASINPLEHFQGFFTKIISSKLCHSLGHSCGLMTAKRTFASTFNGQHDQHHSDYLFSKFSINPVKKIRSGRKIAMIKPVTSDEENLVVLPDHLKDEVERRLPYSSVSENTQPPQDDLEIIGKMREDLVSRIIGSVGAKKVNPQDVRTILDLYAALVWRPKYGITKVLSGVTNTNLSVIFNDVLAHAQSKNLNIEYYRTIYTKLCQAFNGEAMEAMYQAAEEIIKDREMIIKERLSKKSKEDMSWQDYVSLIVERSDPFYPVHPNEVRKILELYAALTDQPRYGITKVLSYQTDTNKSTIYNAVMNYVIQKSSDLEDYRDIYGRVAKACYGESLKIIYGMIDNKLYNPLQRENERLTSSHQHQKNITSLPTKLEAMPFRSDKHKATAAIPKVSIIPTSTSLYTSHSLGPFLETKDGKYRIYKKEQERLNRVYDLLSDYSSKSVSGVLWGSTKNPSALKAVKGAIDQIRQEALQKGEDPTEITFSDIQRVYWLSIKVIGAGGQRGKTLNYLDKSFFYENLPETGPISKKEHQRLNRIYGLLPKYSSKSISGILWGSKKNISALRAVEGAIDQIRQEALREGDNTSIDLDYFQKLYEATSMPICCPPKSGTE